MEKEASGAVKTWKAVMTGRMYSFLSGDTPSACCGPGVCYSEP
jgi:hypothetical protein